MPEAVMYCDSNTDSITDKKHLHVVTLVEETRAKRKAQRDIEEEKFSVTHKGQAVEKVVNAEWPLDK